jgi:hypothetical protein
MRKRNPFRKCLILGVIILFFGADVLPNISGTFSKMYCEDSYIINGEDYDFFSNNSVLDVQYIYNITKALSYIIFTEYDEEHGEIAKGREFGSKGEHKAAEILAENMTKLGLYTTMEKIENIPLVPMCSKLTHKTDVIDYKLVITNKTSGHSEVVDCGPCASIFGPHCKPFNTNHNFSYTGLKVRSEHPSLLESKEDYVLISGTSYPTKVNGTEDITCGGLEFYINDLKHLLKSLKDYFLHPHFKGYLRYDFNNDSHDNLYPSLACSFVPFFFINGSIGRKINSSVKDFTVDFYLNQLVNKSVISYNVIGQLNGTDSSKTVIVDCLYDCWWDQGTADSAIGMGIVMGIAKYFTEYFTEHKIKPKYNVKFIGFAGEEYGMRGALYYEAAHRDEKIIYVIDLNQVGFKQDKPRLKLEIVTNTKPFLDEIRKVVEQTDYINRTGNVTDLKLAYQRMGHISDDRVFAIKRPFSCRTVCFLKGGPWLLHHRDGLNHMEGDVLNYFDWTDVSVTGEMVLNVTKYLTIESI